MSIKDGIIKFAAFFLRFLAAIVILGIATVIARGMDGVVVTAPDLIMIVAGILAFSLVARGLVNLMRRDNPPISSAMFDSGVRAPRRLISNRARHEAGHAVVAHALGHRLMGLSIEVVDNSGGRTIWGHRDDLASSIDHVAVSFAGPLAETMHDPGASLLSGSDDRDKLLHDAIAAFVSDPEGRSPVQIIEEGTRLARSILSERSRDVDDLTRLLMDTKGKRDMTEEELSAFM